MLNLVTGISEESSFVEFNFAHQKPSEVFESDNGSIENGFISAVYGFLAHDAHQIFPEVDFVVIEQK